MDEQFVAYLRNQRASIINRIALFRSGRCWTGETVDGERVDTTAQTLITLEDNLEEIDALLTQDGVPLDA